MVYKGKKAFLKKQKHHSEENKVEKPVQFQGNKIKNISKRSKKAKIIVRNLPFKNLSEKSVEDLFKNYGEIEEVKLLRKDDGKFVGCGFVQFKEVVSAGKAIRHCNQKEIHGRKIIVDWALPKDTFLQKVKKLEEQSDVKIKTEIPSDSEDDKVDFEIDKNPDAWCSDKEESEMDEDEKSESDDYDDDDDDDDNENEEGSEDENENENENKKKLNKKNFKEEKPKTRPSDVDEGKTVFIRNVPFSATNEDLRECVEAYGPVEYALICVDKLTEHSKGTAFAKFKDKENATKFIKNSSNVYLHDNPLTISLAVSKESLENKKKNKKMGKDSRNLYLVKEGVIIAGSKAATGMSTSDKAKRLQLEQWKSQILKNLNMFVSKTRLVIHNLPPSFTDAKLRQLFSKYSNPKAIIKEAKVMYDKKKLDGKGKGISKEVGFVSFTNHEDALTALRNINNNPVIFTPKKRPIVAFSIENRAIMNSKKRNLEKSRAKLGIKQNDKLSKLNRKQRRFIKRKQKIIEKRREAKKAKMAQLST